MGHHENDVTARARAMLLLDGLLSLVRRLAAADCVCLRHPLPAGCPDCAACPECYAGEARRLMAAIEGER